MEGFSTKVIGNGTTSFAGTRVDFLRVLRTAFKTCLFQMSRFKCHAIHRLFQMFPDTYAYAENPGFYIQLVGDPQ